MADLPVTARVSVGINSFSAFLRKFTCLSESRMLRKVSHTVRTIGEKNAFV